MAVTTDHYYEVKYNGETVDRIGLSKALSTYTADEISAMSFCGVEFNIAKNLSLCEDGTSYGDYGGVSPFTITEKQAIGNGGKYTLAAGSSAYSYPNGVPLTVVWLAFGHNVSCPTFLTQNSAQISQCTIVTEWDAPKYEYHLAAPKQVGGIGATDWGTSDAPLYYTPSYFNAGQDNSLSYRVDANTTVDNITPENGPICPYAFFTSEEHFTLIQLNGGNNQWYTRGNGTGQWAPSAACGGGAWKTFDNSTSFGTSGNVSSLYQGSFSGEALALPYVWYYSDFYNGGDWGPIFVCYGYNDLGEPIQLYFGGTPADGRSYHRGFTYQAFCGSRDQIYRIIAGGGIKFYTDKLYKPIIEDGWVIDYTDDMTEESELDNWTGSTVHTIAPSPPVPPSPGDDDDNDDAISTAGAPYAHGLVNYYAMTAGSNLIDHISAALSTWDLKNTGKDLYKNLVSCKLIKPPAAIPTTGSEPFTIYGEKPQYEGADITLPVVSGNPDASFGPYSVTRKFGDFRDYAPYTRVSIFLPYCGWCDLPSHVVGRSITVKYFTDIIAATVRAVVFCGNNIVAEAAGVMGLDIPFTADAVGMKQAGVVSGLTAYAGGALQTAAGVAQLVTSKDAKGLSNVFSGGSKLLSAYTQTAEAFNENTTEISGKNGDGCCLSGATNIIIKIIRPKTGGNTTAPHVPDGFAHSVGFVSNKQVKVGNVSGLLIADNVDTSGIAGATDAERAEIKRVLETGLIVNAAPE